MRCCNTFINCIENPFRFVICLPSYSPVVIYGGCLGKVTSVMKNTISLHMWTFQVAWYRYCTKRTYFWNKHTSYDDTLQVPPLLHAHSCPAKTADCTPVSHAVLLEWQCVTDPVHLSEWHFIVVIIHSRWMLCHQKLTVEWNVNMVEEFLH